MRGIKRNSIWNNNPTIIMIYILWIDFEHEPDFALRTEDGVKIE